MDSGWKIQRDVLDPSQHLRRDDIAVIDSLEYHGEWMGDEYLTVTVKSSMPIDFQFNDFVYYRGEYYYLNYDPNVVKKAGSGTYGEGFAYDGIKLYAVSRDIKTTDFKDVVLEDNEIAYTSLSEFSFFAGSVEDLADRLQANLDRRSLGFEVLTPNWERCQQRLVSQSAWEDTYNDSSIYGTWGVGSPVTLGETDINISVAKDDDCWDMLGKAYSEFGLSFYTKEHLIVIGAPAVKPGHIFRYGKNNGLYEVERTSDEDQELVTKVWGYGSTQNLPLNYYANTGKKMTTPGQRAERGDGSGVTILGLRSDLVYDNVRTALTGGDITLQYENLTVKVSCNPYTVNAEEKVWWYFIDTTNKNEAFYNALGSGTHGNDIFVISGANISLWPAAAIYTPTGVEYPAGLSINRLMLPGFPSMSLHEWVTDNHPELLTRYTFSTDPADPWVMSPNAEIIGDLEGSVFFDGSSLKEIMPTINNTNAGVVATGGGGSMITDNGYVTDPDDFYLRVSYDPSLDWANALKEATEEVKIEMTSGFCTGRDFKVKGATIDPSPQVSYWELRLERHLDSSMSRYFPYQDGDWSQSNYCQILPGDTFVVTGIQMPKEYIDAASEQLLIATCGWLDRRDHMRYTYVPKVDEIYMARQDEAVKLGRDANVYGTVSLHDTLKAGMCLQMEDTDLGIDRFGGASPYIDQLTIRETGGPVPTYDVVLRDEKEKGFKEQIAEQISDLNKEITPVTERQTRQSQTKQYEEWSAEQTYYYQTTNPLTGFIETSQVWRWGLLWECRQSVSIGDAPRYGSTVWVVVGTPTLDVLIRNKQSYELLFQDEVRGDLAKGETYAMEMRVYHGTEDITLNESDVQRFFYALSRDDGSAGFASAYGNGVVNGVTLPPDAIFGGKVTIDGVEYDMRRWTTPTRPGEHAMAVVAPVGTVTVTLFEPPAGYIINNAVLTLDKAQQKIETLTEWVEGGDYHCTERLVTQVWHNGKLWQCTVDGATDEPSEESDQWVAISGMTDDVIEAIAEEMDNYTVSFSDYVDVITVDDVGNVIGGLWTDSSSSSSSSSSDEETARTYRIHSAITVRNNNRILTIAAEDEDAGDGTYKIHAEPHLCTCLIENSTICITSIDNIKDGVANTPDDVNFDYDAMRAMESCWVDLVIDCEGQASLTRRFPVTIKHDSQPYVAMVLSNQMSAVSWENGSYVGLPIVIKATMWRNDQVLDIASANDVSITSVTGMSYTKTIVTEDGHKKANISITALPENLASVTKLNITCEVVYSGVHYERTLEHVINKSLPGEDAQYIYVQGSAKDVDSSISSYVNRIVRINGTDAINDGWRRGFRLVVIDRSTLTVKKVNNVDQIFWYDTYGDVTTAGVEPSSDGGCSEMIAKLTSLDDSVFIAVASFDAIGWTLSLISKLGEFGMGIPPFSNAGRYPFAFLGYKGLGRGYGLMEMHNLGAYDHIATVGAYIVDGTFQSSKDGADAVFYEIRTIVSDIAVSPNGKYEGGLTWKVVKHEGMSVSDVTYSTTTHKWRLVGSGWEESSWRTTDIGTTLNGQMWKSYPSSSQNHATGIHLAYLDGSTELASVVIAINIMGQMSRNLYYAGAWSSAVTFNVTDYKAPYYSITNGVDTTYWAFVGSNGYYTADTAGTPSLNNSNWREMNNEFSYLITEAIFSSFAHLGGTVINGDYLFSEHGYMKGYCDVRTEISDGSQYKNVDPTDMFGLVELSETNPDHDFDTDDTSVTWGTMTTIGYDGTLLYDAWYSVEIKGTGHVDWQIIDVNTGISLADGTIKDGEKYISQAANFYAEVNTVIRLQVMLASSSYTTNKVYSCFVSQAKFVPYLVENMRSGESMMNRLYLRGGFIRMMTEVTPSNYQEYSETLRFQVKNKWITDPSDPLWIWITKNTLNIIKLGSNIRLSGTWTTSPSVYCPDFYSMSEAEKDLVRGMAGQEITLVNNTSLNIPFYGNVELYNGGNWSNPAGPDYIQLEYRDQAAFYVHSGSVVIITIEHYLEENLSGSGIIYGEEKVKLRVRAARMHEVTTNKQENKMQIRAASGTAISPAVNTYNTFSSAVNTLAITLPAVADTGHISTIVFMLTTGTSPAITFTAGGTGIGIIKQDGFSFEASSTYEINALFNGANWVILATKLNTTS